MSDKQYVKREEAFVKYALDLKPEARLDLRLAFNAGWEARKRAEYEGMIERVADHVHTARGNHDQ